MELRVFLKEGCKKCESEFERLNSFLEDRPWKYGCRATIEITQDYLGNGWHLDNVKFDNREAKNLRAEYEKAVSEGRGDTYDLQGLLNNLSWYDWYDDSLPSILVQKEESQ